MTCFRGCVFWLTDAAVSRPPRHSLLRLALHFFWAPSVFSLRCAQCLVLGALAVVRRCWPVKAVGPHRLAVGPLRLVRACSVLGVPAECRWQQAWSTVMVCQVVSVGPQHKKVCYIQRSHNSDGAGVAHAASIWCWQRDHALCRQSNSQQNTR